MEHLRVQAHMPPSERVQRFVELPKVKKNNLKMKKRTNLVSNTQEISSDTGEGGM